MRDAPFCVSPAFDFKPPARILSCRPFMSESIYDQLQQTTSRSGVAAALSQLSQRLRAEKRYFDLFSARLMEGRHRLGMNVASADGLDDLPEPQRSQMEQVYLDACREVGNLLLAERRLGEAWMYLRAVGDKAALAEALEKEGPREDKIDEFVQLAVHEGLAPRRGFETVLEHYGVCNAITMFDGAMYNRPLEDRQAVAALLVQTLHRELMSNLKAEIARQEGKQPTEPTIGQLVADRDWLFVDDAYHIDTSHLHSVVRFARVIEDKDALRLAADLTEYGRRLSTSYQFQTEEPFAEPYRAHGLFFRAQLGEQVEEALAYFGDKARQLDREEHGAAPAEIYVALLARIGRPAEALAAAAELIPAGTQTTGFAPSLLELARAAGEYGKLLDICRQREDVLAFAAGLAESQTKVD